MAVSVKEHILDRILAGAVKRAGAPGGLRFTEQQLYYEFCRGLQPAHLLPRRQLFTVRPAISYATFLGALHRHGDIPRLLPAAEAQVRGIGTHTVEADLFDYGLPRLLVCQSHSIASMLRANGIPMESACPVVSAAELPLAPRVASMLALVDHATVYVLHEASAAGLDFASRARDLTEVPDNVRIVPIGLRPRQAGALHLTHRGAPSPGPVTSADRWETKWLQRGRIVEVEAVRPMSLLRTVHRLVRDVHIRRVPLIAAGEARDAGFLTWPTA